MNDKIKQDIHTEFNNANYQTSYELAISSKNLKTDKNILKIIIISSFKLQKYFESIKYGEELINSEGFENDLQILQILGTAHSIKENYDKANTYFEKYLNFNTKSEVVKYNLGLNYYKQRNFNKAQDQFDKLVSENENYRDSELFLGIIQSELNDFDNAITSFQNLIDKNIYLAESFFNLGIVYQKKNQFKSSINYFKKAIEKNNQHFQFFNSLGISYQKLFDYENAEDAYKKSINLNDKNSNAFSNLGFLKQKNGNFKEATKNFDSALKINPDDPKILYNKSICLLESGNFEEGLKLYKWRQNGKYSKNILFDLKNIKNKKILVTCDQGLGDTILLSRFVSLLPDYGANVFFQIKASLKELFKNLNDKISIINEEDIIEHYDYHCSLGDLFEIFNINKLDIPMKNEYIKVDKKWIDKWKDKLDHTKVNIGISWQGKPGDTLDEGRSFNLKYFENISHLNNVQLVSLQKNEGLEQISDFKKKNNIVNFDNILDVETKFMDTAGLMKNLDLVISSDTSIVHLAGAIGIKTWLLVQKFPFWYWRDNNEKSIWYDSVKVYKQEENHNWQKLFTKIEDKVKNYKK